MSKKDAGKTQRTTGLSSGGLIRKQSQQWDFEGIWRESGDSFMFTLQHRSAATLLSITSTA